MALQRAIPIRKRTKPALGLQDIASQLNVSVSLVSKVLNDRLGTTGASADTVEAIRVKAKELGYRKNSSAAALATGKHNVLGVFIHYHGEPGSGIVERTIRGIAEEAAEHGQRLMLHFFETTEQFRAYCTEVHTSEVDGVIIGGIIHRDMADALVQMERRGVPIVTILDEPIDARIPNVLMDQVAVGRLATRHLIEQGCLRIAHVRNTDARFLGYKAALADAGIPFREELVFQTRGFSHHGGEAAVAHFLASQIPFDGIVGQSDQHALGAMNALLRRGVDVPEQVKLVGVDNSPYCELSVIPLTSVSQEDLVRSRKAVRQLLEKVGGKSISSVSVEPRLYARQSSASGEVGHEQGGVQ